jgi:hypothetical protein
MSAYGTANKAPAAGPPPLSLSNLFQSAPVAPSMRSAHRFVHTDSADEAEDEEDEDEEDPWATTRHHTQYGAAKPQAEHLALRRLVRPGAPPRATTVPCHVVFVRADGSAKPVTHALPLPRGATAGAVLAAATAAAALLPGERLVLLRGRTEGRGVTLRWRELRFVNGAHVPSEPSHATAVRPPRNAPKRAPTSDSQSLHPSAYLRLCAVAHLWRLAG